MKKVTITAIMLVIAMFMLTTNVQAYSMSFSGTKTTVEPGETFNVTVSVDEATTRANGHIKYDSSLFTFVSSTGSNMSASAETAGTVQWLYSEPAGQENGAKSFTFTFKAAEVTETQKGTFTMEDFIAITKENEEGYGQDKNTISGTTSVEVTINKKADEPSEPTWKITPSGDFTLEKGESKQLTADEDVTWSTSDSSVATVDENGKVTGVGEGNATITATDEDGNKQTVTVTVTDNSQTPGDNDNDNDNDNDTHDNWSIEPSEDFSLKVGDKKKLTADGEGVEWKSSNEKVAKVDQNGNVTAVGAGTATITATDKYGNTKTIKVTVTKKTTTAGKKDNTQTPDSKLPQTGENAGKFVVLGIAGIVLAAGIVFKKKAKELDKLFVLLPIVAVLSLSGTVHAVKVVNNDKLKTGFFDNLIENTKILAVSPNANYLCEDKLTQDDIKNIAKEYGYTLDEIELMISVGEGAEENEVERAYTGASASFKDANGTVFKSTILLYGDANGDGKICDVLDIDVIRKDYVFNKKATGVKKLAADLYADSKLDVRDIQRMINKYLGKLDDTLVKPFPEDNMDEGETKDQSKAVAMVKSTGKMYTSVQYAVNATDTKDTVQVLKNTTESVTTPENKDLILDLNGNSITGVDESTFTITNKGNLTIENNSDKLATIDSPKVSLTNGADGGDILVADKGNVTIKGNVELIVSANGGSNIVNTGSGNVTIDGATLKSDKAQGTFAITDKGENSNIYIYTGDIETTTGQGKEAIKKESTGNIYIGKDSKEHEDVDGIQENILYKNSEKEQLYINGKVIAGDKAKIFYYNGELNEGLQYGNGNEPTLRTGARLVKGVNDKIKIHYEELATGELPISYSLYFSADQIVEDVPDAVCYLTDDSKFGARQNLFRYFKTVQDAINVVPNRESKSHNNVTAKDGKKLSIITLMQDVTESIEIPDEKCVYLYDGKIKQPSNEEKIYTLTGTDDKMYTISLKGDLVLEDVNVVKKGDNKTTGVSNILMEDNATLTIQNKSQVIFENCNAGASDIIANILMKGNSTLKIQNSAQVILKNAQGVDNIRNEGTGDVTIIDGAKVISDTESGNTTGCVAIHDVDKSSNIYIDGAEVSGYFAIKKDTCGGEIVLGNEKDTEPETDTYVHGTFCLCVCEDVDVCYYNGKLEAGYTSGNQQQCPVCYNTNKNGDSTMYPQHAFDETNNNLTLNGASTSHETTYKAKTEEESTQNSVKNLPSNISEIAVATILDIVE